jgi:hypothetical protein
MPGENTDSWRACCREIESGEAVERRRGRIRNEVMIRWETERLTLQDTFLNTQ